MEEQTVLVVDDEFNFSQLLNEILSREGYKVECACSAPEAMHYLDRQSADVVLLDMIMPVMHGLEALERIKRKDELLPVIVMTGDGDLNNAVEAMKLGAYDYLAKPLDWERLRTVLKNGLQNSSLKREVSRLKGELKEMVGLENVIGVSRRMQDVFHSIEKVRNNDVTIALRGESGTGKELLARAIHLNSRRAGKPFIPVNCAAIPEALLESELFGHEKGAFTGAYMERAGKFEQANEGTIFLDEIGEMPPSTQVKILRVLQEKKVERVGGNKTIDVDVRIISATNKNLEKEIEEGKFREDLYYRINVYPIFLPALRERKEDIPTLIAFFVRKFHETGCEKVTGVSSKSMDLLLRYEWPGNVRELENVVERAMLNAREGLVQPEHLPPNISSNGETDYEFKHQKLDFKTALSLLPSIVPLEDIEVQVLTRALKLTNYNMSLTATALGIGRTTLYRKVHKYHIPVPRFVTEEAVN